MALRCVNVPTTSSLTKWFLGMFIDSSCLYKTDHACFCVTELYKAVGVVTVAREWILDSLTLFKLMPLQEYALTDVSNITLPDLT